MGLAQWWRQIRDRRRLASMPEARWTVIVDGDTIGVTDAGGNDLRLALDDVWTVTVETNDTGPWGTDCWWLLLRVDETSGVGWPQGAIGEGAAVNRLLVLPDFNHAAMVIAMTSTENATFVLWRRGSDGEGACASARPTT